MRQIPTSRQTARTRAAMQVKTVPTQAAMQTRTAARIQAKTAAKTAVQRYAGTKTAVRILPTAIEAVICECVISEGPVRCGLVSFL